MAFNKYCARGYDVAGFVFFAVFSATFLFRMPEMSVLWSR